jgi:hypothetical protein
VLKKKTPDLPDFSGGVQKKTPGPNRKEARMGLEPEFSRNHVKEGN